MHLNLLKVVIITSRFIPGHSCVVLGLLVLLWLRLGLPTLDLRIPGPDSLPYLSLSSPPSPPLSPFPFPSLLPFPQGPHPLNQLGVLGSAVSSPSGVWSEAPVDKRIGVYDYI